MRLRVLAVLIAPLALGACRDDQDPAHSREIWNRIHAENYRSWQRAPGYSQRRPSFTSHATSVDIYVNGVVKQAIDAQEQLRAWPEGTLIVKDGFSGEDLKLIAVMEKRQDGWFWVEFDQEGDPIASGRPDVCIRCHERSSYDFTLSFGLP